MSRTAHNPEATRRALLKSAAVQIHRHGFQAASLEAILAETGVTKGALYHHFRNKHELGLAVLHEVFREDMLRDWREALGEGDHPVEAILALLERQQRGASACSVECGCPLNNLAQEMASVDEPFRVAIEEIMSTWRGLIASALERGQRAGMVRPGADAAGEAVFITSLIEGAAGAAKTARDPDLLRQATTVLASHLESLRAERPA
ncbi:MAG: TetR family transcriptional regulator C-terminal domain-containing protein [bacterium]|jgi:AcrR family transcriptional regulator|nr:TetR family transcriptional regulator C-terminal domain-containing protein [bacterium]